jgi:hypothetical protein
MFKKIINHVSVGLAVALVVGSMTLADVGVARAQDATPTTTTAQTTYGQPNYNGNGYGYPCPMMTGSGYANTGYRGNGYSRSYSMGGCAMMGGGMGMMGGGMGWNRY